MDVNEDHQMAAVSEQPHSKEMNTSDKTTDGDGTANNPTNEQQEKPLVRTATIVNKTTKKRFVKVPGQTKRECRVRHFYVVKWSDRPANERSFVECDRILEKGIPAEEVARFERERAGPEGGENGPNKATGRKRKAAVEGATPRKK